MHKINVLTAAVSALVWGRLASPLFADAGLEAEVLKFSFNCTSLSMQKVAIYAHFLPTWLAFFLTSFLKAVESFKSSNNSLSSGSSRNSSPLISPSIAHVEECLKTHQFAV